MKRGIKELLLHVFVNHKQLYRALRRRAARMAPLIERAQYVARRLSLSVGKAAWLASTTLLVLLVPLVIEMDREAQLLEMEKEQMSVLTSPKAA